jgi:hypothetical protein
MCDRCIACNGKEFKMTIDKLTGELKVECLCGLEFKIPMSRAGMEEAEKHLKKPLRG